MVFEVGDSVLSHGFRKLVILNVHGGNRYAVRAARVEVASKYGWGKPSRIIRVAEDCDEDLNALIFTHKELESYSEEARMDRMVHGGALETSKILYLRGETVKMERARDIDVPLRVELLRVTLYHETTHVGARGCPSEASSKAGKIMWESLVGSLARYLRQMGTMT